MRNTEAGLFANSDTVSKDLNSLRISLISQSQQESDFNDIAAYM